MLPVTDEGQGVALNPGEINNLGQVVGWQWELYLVDVESGYGSIERAFLWDAAGGTRDLNALMGLKPDARNQFPLSTALDVNDMGQIVGYGAQGAWLLTPVPEPSAPCILLACAAATLARRPGRGAILHVRRRNRGD